MKTTENRKPQAAKKVVTNKKKLSLKNGLKVSKP